MDSAGLKVVGKGIGAAAEKASKLAKTHGLNLDGLGERLFPTLTKGVSKLKNFVNDKIYKLKELVDESSFHNEYLADKIFNKQKIRLETKGDDDLLDKSVRQLNDAHVMYDMNNNIITKEQINLIAPDAPDGTILATINIDDEIAYVIKKNGVVGIKFDENIFQTVTLPSGLVADRDVNMEEAAKILKSQWLENTEMIPESIQRKISEQGFGSGRIDDILEDITPKKLVEIIKGSDWVLHENIDLTTVTLVKKYLHNVSWGGVAHYGGYALAKDLKTHMADEFFDRFLGVLSSAVS